MKLEDDEAALGFAMGMEQMGAKYIKLVGRDICFDIPIGGEMTKERLVRARQAFESICRLTLKVRMVKGE